MHLVALFPSYQDTVTEKEVVSAFFLEVDLTLVLEYKVGNIKKQALSKYPEKKEHSQTVKKSKTKAENIKGEE